MRNLKIIFIFIILKTTAALNIFAATPDLNFYADSDKTIGTKITTPYTEFRISDREQNINFGISLSTKKIYPVIPFSLKTGTLTGSGSISKLNNPTISSSSSPFSSGISTPDITKASLPGYTNFSNQPTAFFQLDIPALFKKTNTLSVSCFFPKNFASPLSSLLFSSSFLENTFIFKLASAGGLFTYSENDSSSWFAKSPYYLPGTHLCSLYQFSLELNSKSKKLFRFYLPSVYFTNAVAFYELPSNEIPLCLRSEIKITSQNTECYLLGFYNPKDGVFTSSEKKLSSCLQVKGGLLIKSIIIRTSKTPLFIKTGMNVHSTINLLEHEHPLKINLGIQSSSSKNTLSLSGSINFTITSSLNNTTVKKMDFSSFSIQLKDSMYFKYLNAGFTAAATLTPQASDNQISGKYKLTLNLSNRQQQKIGGNANLTLSAKNTEIISKNFSAGLTLFLKYKWFSFSGKASVDFDF